MFDVRKTNKEGDGILKIGIVSSLLLMIVVGDIRSFQVSNKTILIGLSTAIGMQVLESGLSGISSFVLGFLSIFLILFPLFYFRMLGTGDIKVFCMLGSFYGAQIGILVLVYSFCMAALISIVILIKKPKLCSRFSYFISYVSQCLILKKMTPYITKETKKEALVHFTISITLGFLVLVLHRPALFLT